MSTISVTLIDDAISTTMATVDLPVENLPDSFDLETTLHLGDADWSVVAAEPRIKPEFTRTGKLVLRLRKVEKVDISDLLYSLPSICDRLPAVTDAAPEDDDLVLAEDDWRRLELVSRAFAAEADAEIGSIRLINEQESASVGWKKIHVRKRPDPPIVSTLSREDIDEAFGGVTFQGVYLAGSAVLGGFSFRAGDLACYGIEEDGAVTVLGIAQSGEAEALAPLAYRFDLELVNWCLCARASWDDALFSRLLTGTV